MNTQNNAKAAPGAANSTSKDDVATSQAQKSDQGQPKVEPRPATAPTAKS